MKEILGSGKFQMIYIASCGEGVNAFHLVESTLVQFPDSDITVVKVPRIRTESQVDELIDKVKDIESIIVHTIVDSNLRKYLTRQGMEHQIVTIDLMGPIISRIETFLDCKPLETPGLYREIHLVNLEQVSAIDFALAHDDGFESRDHHRGRDRVDRTVTGRKNAVVHVYECAGMESG